MDDKKNNVLASLCLVSYLVANWLQKLEMKHCLLCKSYFCFYVWVCVCVCGISVWFIYNTTKLPFCKMSVFVPYIPNTSLRCSYQPLWKLNLMTGVNTTKQQTGEIKNNKKSNLVELNKVRKQPQRCPGKKDVLINSCSESCQGKFSVKILEKYLWRSSFLVKLHNLVPGSFYLTKKPVKNTVFANFLIR